MDITEVELRSSLKRAAVQIQSQHRRLEPLFAQLSRALAERALRDAQTAVFRLEGAIRAHFQLEEEIVFPTIRGLLAEGSSELDALLDEHRGIAMELKTLVEQILEAELELALRSLEACWSAVREHESREEALLSALDSAPSDPKL